MGIGGEYMFIPRILTKEEREKIREAKKKEQDINGYQINAIERAKRRKRR